MPSKEPPGGTGRFSELDDGVRASSAPRGTARSAGVEKMDDERMAERFNCTASASYFHVSHSHAGYELREERRA
jgi:hypothetical protein